MILLIHVIVQVIAFCLFYHLSKHPDFNHRRWLRIGLSSPLVAAMTGMMLRPIHSQFYTGPEGGAEPFDVVRFIFAAIALILLALLWRDVLSQWTAHHYVNFFYRDIHSYTGQRPDYKFANNHRRDGEPEEAIKAVQHELEKNPKDYEGRLLLAQIYQDQNKPQEAVTHLQIILNDPASLESQLTVARSEMANCKRLIDLQAIEAFNKRPNT